MRREKAENARSRLAPRRESNGRTPVAIAGLGLVLGLALVPMVLRARAAAPEIRPDLDSDTHVLIFRGNKPNPDTANNPVSPGLQDPQGPRLDPRFRARRELQRKLDALDARDPWTNEEPETVVSVTTSAAGRTVLDHRDPWSPETEYSTEPPTSTPLDHVDPWSGAISSRGEVSPHTFAN